VATNNSQEIKYISVEEILEIYNTIIRQYGRIHTTLLKKKLNEIVKHHREHEGDIFEKAAVLVKELITARPRPFVDGHKRVGWISVVRFFELNGYHFFDLEKLEDINFIESNIATYLVKIQRKKINSIHAIAGWLRVLFVKA